MRFHLILAVTLGVSLARSGAAIPGSGDCVFETSANSIGVATEVRFPIPASFRNCVPTPDPNAIASSNNLMFDLVNGSSTDFNVVLEYTVNGQPQSGNGICRVLTGDPVMQRLCWTSSPVGSFIFGSFVTFVDLYLVVTPSPSFSHSVRLIRPTLSTQCNPGFGTPEPTCAECIVGLEPARGRCSVTCAADEFTDVRVCTKCRQGSRPNGDQSACVDIDECAEGLVTCPANSACENSNVLTTNVLVRCICNPGFVVQGTEFRVGSTTSTCVLTPISITVDVLVPRAIEFTFTASAVTLFRAEIFALDQTNRQFRVFSEKTPGTTVVDTLVPGTRYQIKAIVLDVSEEDTDLVSFEMFETPCTCLNESVSVANGNGKPTDLVASQSNGMITFSFVDQSQCEVAYSLSRRQTGTANSVVFAPDYYYTAAATCGEVYNPGTFAADDLSLSRLTPGLPYDYCVRAIGTLANSDPTCTVHVVRWEAAAQIVVTLPRAAGSIPSRDVVLEYQLEDASGSVVVDALGQEQTGSVVTREDGKAKVAFSFIPQSALSNSLLTLRTTLTKTTVGVTGPIPHQFLCDAGAVPCSAQGDAYALENLVFDRQIAVQDNTSVPVQGQVVIGDSGCSLQGAQVCVKARIGALLGSERCVETDEQGGFGIGAAIGTQSTIEVFYEEHTFELTTGNAEVLAGNGANGEGPGFNVRVDADYTGLVFKDISKTTITVDVVGSACDRDLGESTVSYKIRGCLGFQEVFQPQQGPTQSYVVYAQALEVSATVYGNVDLESQVVDLTSEGNSTFAGLGGEAPDEGGRRLRFQFDGAVTVDISSLTSAVPRCSGVPTVRAGSPTTLIITVRETFPPRHVIGGAVADCTTFSEDARIIVTNKLGADVSVQEDAKYVDELRARGVPTEVLQLLQLCVQPDTDEFCSRPLTYDTAPIAPGVLGDVNGRVELLVLVGRPVLAPPFQRFFTAEFRRTAGAPGVQASFTPVVVGDFDQGLVDVVDLPVYEPVMILRDPPGGESYVSYKNMETTIELSIEKFAKKTSLEYYNWTSFKKGLQQELCFGTFVSTCLQLHVGEIIQSDFDEGSYVYDPTTFKDETNTHTFSTTWSYTTSKDRWTAGQASDVFVVPSLKLALESVDQVSLDAACVATQERLTKFSGAEELSVSFLTYNDVLSFSFNETIDRLFAALEREPTQTGKDNIRDAIADTRLAIEAWGNVLDEYTATNADADAGLNVVKPFEWFSNFSNGTINGTHYSGLLPKSLVAGAVPLPASEVAQSSLEGIDVITFTGGGSSLGFVLDQSKASSRVVLEGTDLNQEEYSNNKVSGFGAFFFLAFRDRDTVAGSADRVRIEKKRRTTKKSRSDTRIEFHLGDSNVGDRFDVKISLDPKYESFIFTTQSTSRSKCPHEPGTVARESTRMDILPTSTNTPVLPDEPVIFHLLLTNLGDDESSFILTVDQKTNPGGLTFNLDSEVVPINFLPAKSSTEFLLEVHRGPIRYEYPALDVSFRSACEFDEHTVNHDNFPSPLLIQRTQTTQRIFNDAGTGKIVFAQPCRRVELADPDPRFAIIINTLSGSVLSVVVRNPARTREGSLADLVTSSRLAAVKLKFRSVARPEISGVGLSDAVTDIDFAAVGAEDLLGFSTVDWNIETNGVQDGTYEVWIEAECDPVVGAPPSFNSETSAILSLVVDRKAPTLFEQRPPAGQVTIGQPVVFVFTEDIECGSFLIQARVEGIAATFDNDVRDNVLLTCERNEVAFQFDPLVVDYAEIVGKKFDLTLSGVQDLHGNVIGSSIVANLSFATLSLNEVGVEFEIVLQRNCSAELTESNLLSELAVAMGIDPARISINGISCTVSAGVVVAVKILPAQDSTDPAPNSTLRRLSPTDAPPLQLLHMLSGNSVGNRRALQDIGLLEQLPGYARIVSVRIDNPELAPKQTVYLETDKAKLAAVEQGLNNVAFLSAQQTQANDELKQLLYASIAILVVTQVLTIGFMGYKMRGNKKDPVANNYQTVSSLESINPTFRNKHTTTQGGPGKVEQ